LNVAHCGLLVKGLKSGTPHNNLLGQYLDFMAINSQTLQKKTFNDTALAKATNRICNKFYRV